MCNDYIVTLFLYLGASLFKGKQNCYVGYLALSALQALGTERWTWDEPFVGCELTSVVHVSVETASLMSVLSSLGIEKAAVPQQYASCPTCCN